MERHSKPQLSSMRPCPMPMSATVGWSVAFVYRETRSEIIQKILHRDGLGGNLRTECLLHGLYRGGTANFLLHLLSLRTGMASVSCG
jgi:hypothetical protein